MSDGPSAGPCHINQNGKYFQRQTWDEMLNLSQCPKQQKNTKKNSIYSSNKFNAKECRSKNISAENSN